MGPCSPGEGWAPACLWEAGNSFFVSLCLCVWLCFPCKTVFISVHGFSSFHPFDSLLIPGAGGVSRYTGLGCCLGINPETVQVIKKKKNPATYTAHPESCLYKNITSQTARAFNRQQGSHGLSYPDPTLLGTWLCCWKEISVSRNCYSQTKTCCYGAFTHSNNEKLEKILPGYFMTHSKPKLSIRH